MRVRGAMAMLLAVCAACSPIRFSDYKDAGDASLADADAADAIAPDAETPDAAHDAGATEDAQDANPDASPQTPDADLRVSVLMFGAPAENIDVVLHDSSGHVLEAKATDVNGLASFAGLENAMVTVAYPDATGEIGSLETVTGVAASETLVFDIEGITPQPIVGWVAPRTLDAYAGADHYALDLGCARVDVAAGELPPVLALTSACVNRFSAVTLVASAFDRRDHLLAQASSADVAVSTATVTIAAGSWMAASEICRVRASNAPLEARQLNVHCNPRRQRVTYNLDDGATAVTVPLNAGESAVVTTFAMPQFADELALDLRLLYNSPAGDTSSGLRQLASTSNPTIAIDLSTALLPRVFAGTYDWVPEPRVFWSTSSDPAASADAIALVLFPGTQVAIWQILMPPTSTAPFSLPQLPASLAGLAPTAASTIAPPGVILVDVDVTAGYAEFKRLYGLRFITGDKHLSVPPAGHVRYSGFAARPPE